MGVENIKKSCIEYMNIEYRKLSKRKYVYSILNKEVKRNRKNYTDKEAQQKALYLSEKFKNPKGLMFYLKVAWTLSDAYIDWLVDYSLKKNDPARYFVSVASKKMLEIA